MVFMSLHLGVFLTGTTQRSFTSRSDSRAPRHDQTPCKNGDDGEVIDEVERRAGADANRDGDDADQRPHERKALSRQRGDTRRSVLAICSSADVDFGPAKADITSS
jgi:hypothetical protein